MKIKLGTMRLIIQLIAFSAAIGLIKGAFHSYQVWITASMLILFGTVFCGWCCPFGAIQDCLYRFIGKRLPYTITIKPIYNKYLLYCRYITLITSVAFLSSLLYARESFVQLFAGFALEMSWVTVILGLFLLASIFIPRFFCRYFCMEGAYWSAAGVMRLMTITRQDTQCLGCGKCDKSCPMGIEVSKSSSISAPHCISCAACIEACPTKNTLRYRLRSFTSSISIVLFVIGVYYTYLHFKTLFY